MNYDVVFIFGIGRCGSGFTSTIFSLNDMILSYGGPGFGWMRDSNASVFTMTDIKKHWESHPEREFEHNINKKPGYDKYYTYLKEKPKYDGIPCVWDNRGEFHYKSILERITGKHLIIYCARPIIDHCRSFKRFFGEQAGGDYFLGHLQKSLESVNYIKNDSKARLVVVDMCRGGVDKKIAVFERLHDMIGIKMNAMQYAFLNDGRKIGATNPKKETYSDEKIMCELKYNTNPVVSHYDNLLKEAL